MTDVEIIDWLVQYAGRQAGYYPGLRRTRARLEAEARRRGLDWRSRQRPWITAWRRRGRVGNRPSYEEWCAAGRPRVGLLEEGSP